MLKEQAEESQRYLDQLRTALPVEDDYVISEDSALIWIGDHPDEVAKYAGRTIAVHRDRGIVASGIGLKEAIAELEEVEDVSVGDVVFHGVPPE